MRLKLRGHTRKAVAGAGRQADGQGITIIGTRATLGEAALPLASPSVTIGGVEAPMETRMDMSGTPHELALRIVSARLLLEAAERSGRNAVDWLNLEEAFLTATVSGSQILETNQVDNPLVEASRSISDMFRLARALGELPEDGSYPGEPGLTVTPAKPSK